MLHKKAMRLAEEAFLAERKGDSHKAQEMLAEAFETEREAALGLTGDDEPSRSVLLRSAASLAVKCERFRESEKLIGLALSGDPPEEIAEELRELMDQVQFDRHVKLDGLELDGNDVEVTLWGPRVGHGYIHSRHFTDRINYLNKLFTRTAERMLGHSYRESGPAKKSIRRSFPVFLQTARASSFAVTVSVGEMAEPVFPEIAVPSEYVVDSVLECLSLINDSDEESLKEEIPSYDYRSNFVGLARRIAPDGSDVRKVNLSSIREKRQYNLSLKPKDDLLAPPEKDNADEPAERIEITGNFLYADALSTGEENQIKLRDKGGQKHTINVPAGLMADIVRPLWDFEVIVHAKRKGSRIDLVEIEKAE